MLKRLLIIFGYVSSALGIALITVALVAYGNDYTYDFSTRQVIQKGHVIINSLPSGVRVMEDGKLLNKSTPYQAAVKVGDHTYRLERDGYEPWEKVLHVVAGRVALASYVIFVPKKPETTTLDTKPQIVSQAISKDHRHLAYITAGPEAAVYTLEPSSKKIVKLYTPKPAVAATETAAARPAEELKDVRWSDDASHLLISSDIGGQPTYRLATADSTDEPLNLTQIFGSNLRSPSFSGNNWRQLYWISAEGLRRIDIESSSISAVLAEKVTQFWIQPDRVLYVQQTGQGRSLWSLERNGKKQELIPALAESDSYVVAQSEFKGEDELVVVPTKTGIATLYSGIYGDKPVSKVIAKDVTSATFAPNGYKVALTTPKQIHVYNLERTEVEQRFVLHTIAAEGLVTLSWFDNDHLLTTRGGQMYWSEFDGANSLRLSESAAFPAYSDADSKSIFVFRPTDTATAITQIKIR